MADVTLPPAVEDALVRNTDWMPHDPVPGFVMTEHGWWCAEHGYGCEPNSCPCGHTLRCDCWSIADER